MKQLTIIKNLAVGLFFTTTNVYSDAACLNTGTDANCGLQMANFAGTPALCNGDDHATPRSCGGRGDYGLEYQCVEYVKRFYAEQYGINTKTYCWAADAKDFYYDSSANELRRLDVFRNGRTTSAPRTGDIVIFKKPSGDTYGHVAIVKSRSGENVSIIEQNFSRYSATSSLSLSQSNGRYSLTRTYSAYEVKGWARPSYGPIQYSQKNFSIGTRVELTDSGVGVRTEPAGLIRRTNEKGMGGTVLNGPEYACDDWWWRVNFDSGRDGWVAEDYLREGMPEGLTRHDSLSEWRTVTSNIRSDGFEGDEYSFIDADMGNERIGQFRVNGVNFANVDEEGRIYAYHGSYIARIGPWVTHDPSFHDDFYLLWQKNWASDPVPTLSITFDRPIKSFAAEIGDFWGWGGKYTVSIDNKPFSVAGEQDGYVFVGITSDEPFTNISINVGSANYGALNNIWYGD